MTDLFDGEDPNLIDLSLEAATIANLSYRALVILDYAADLIGYDAKASADRIGKRLTNHQNLKLLVYFSRRNGTAAYDDFIRLCHQGKPSMIPKSAASKDRL